MNNIERLETYYKRFIKNLPDWLPEGLVNVDLALLHDLKLLNFEEVADQEDDVLTRYFHVIGADEKITLVNDQFVIWIVPENNQTVAKTLTLIALNAGKEPVLEMGFYVTGVYNTSRLVLRILEKFLKEIAENEDALNQLRKAS